MITAITGSSKTGKSTLIKALMKKFPKYGTPAKTYRDIPDLELYSQGTQECQGKIRDFMYNQAKEIWAKRDTQRHIIHDRCLLDNLAATMILKAMNPDSISDEFLMESMEMTKRSMSFYHSVFFLPITDPDLIDLPKDIDKEYRAQMDIFLNSFIFAYEKDDPERKPTLFPEKNCAYIERIEPITVDGRVDEISVLLNESGELLEPEDVDPMAALGGIVDAAGMPVVSEEPEFGLEDFGYETEKFDFRADPVEK